MLKLRELAASLCKVEVHNGVSTSFWYDRWTPLGRLIDITGIRGCIDLGTQLDSTIENALKSHRRRNHRTDELNRIEEAIFQHQQEKSHAEDTVLWRCKEDKFKTTFNSKETWRFTRATQPAIDWYTGIWFSYATPKYSFTSWLAILNRLSTGDQMICWNTNASTTCVLCNDPNETRNHLFFTCRYSRGIWKQLTQNLLASKFTTTWDDILALLVDVSQGKLKLFLLRYCFQITIYSIWRERNGRRHGDPAIDLSQLTRRIDKQIRNKLLSIRSMGDTRYDNGMELWFATR